MSDQPVITFHGAAETVTGSCHMIEAGGHRVLIDCGMFQGSKTEKELNYRAFPFDPRAIDALILTHAHIDHSGLVPKLVRDGFTGPIFASAPTIDLCKVMLPDSAHIQEMEVEQLNRRNKRRGRQEVTPIYTLLDAMEAVKLMRPTRLADWREAAPGIRFRLWNAGHLLGSTSIEMETAGGDRPVRILFSGDLGPDNKLLQPNPEAPAGWDHVVMESTYGDTDRLEVTEARRRAELRAEVQAAINPDGVLLIPSFAVERTQELLADLVHLFETGQLPPCPVIIDSPLANRASQIFRAYARTLDNGDLLLRAFASPHVRFTESVEQSMALDQMHGFHIVISASGMCEAGRIRHRLRNWLWRSEATVLLVGYQAAGTLGRLLADGAPVVRMKGEQIEVRARIRKLDLYSGHADGPELAAWLRKRLPVGGTVFMVHGEEMAIDGLRARLADSVPRERLVDPRLDASYRLGHAAAVEIVDTARVPRIDPRQAGHTDWHNDFQSLLLDIQAEIGKAADEKARGKVIRRLRNALAAG
ncbi:MBL fold metallo-hydrolase [Pleomorphomonas carboxyditropha]|uniref:MBL fold metallo-hydrolase n=1 Tax=Pleomorphomonas carboxyditropha TaxID=2023338 RepID=A0A2G9WU25_9HYPH|nr:MBL fold metallo-hydrolase [Pleomorphomonas carboxyditropha]PIO98208.1 MBL fold metallo-hydrolase [Pleomorphomonas carboxyditropha]